LTEPPHQASRRGESHGGHHPDCRAYRLHLGRFRLVPSGRERPNGTARGNGITAEADAAGAPRRACSPNREPPWADAACFPMPPGRLPSLVSRQLSPQMSPDDLPARVLRLLRMLSAEMPAAYLSAPVLRNGGMLPAEMSAPFPDPLRYPVGREMTHKSKKQSQRTTVGSRAALSRPAGDTTPSK